MCLDIGLIMLNKEKKMFVFLFASVFQKNYYIYMGFH